MSNVGIIILAAGSSSRMSGSKQLLKFDGESMLRKSVMLAIGISTRVVTVLGANYLVHKEEIKDLKTDIVFNLNWNKGMGASLKCGLRHLHKAYPDLEAVIVMVCDQPLLTENILLKLINAFVEGHELVASAYKGTLGVPALFSYEHFKALLKIPDNKGAKEVIRNNAPFVIDFPDGAVDVDTDDDYQALSNE